MSRKQRQTQLFIASTVTAGLMLFILYIMVSVWLITEAKGESLTPQPDIKESYGPDISHCFAPEESRELWDCIRHVED